MSIVSWTTTTTFSRQLLAEFVENILKKHLAGKKKEQDIPALRELTKISLEAIIKTVEQECRDRQDNIRKAVIYISHRYSGRTLREIGQRFGVGESAVAQASSRFEAELRGNRLLKRMVASVRTALNL